MHCLKHAQITLTLLAACLGRGDAGHQI